MLNWNKGLEVNFYKVGDASTEGSIIKEFNTVVKNPQVLKNKFNLLFRITIIFAPRVRIENALKYDSLIHPFAW